MTIGPGDVATASLFAMMAAVGMGLRPRDFAPVFQSPGAFVLGALGQIVMLPLVAFGVAWAASLPPAYAVGLVLIAACPGGATSNGLAQLARGDAALSVSLTAVSSLLSFASVPWVVGLAMRAFAGEATGLELPFADAALRLFTATALPLGLGMALLRWHEPWAERLRRPVLALTTAVVLLLVLGLAASLSGADAVRMLRQAAPAVATLLAAMTGIAFGGGRLLGLAAPQQRTLVIELAIQNFNLALVVALTLLEDRTLLGPAVVHLPLMFVVAGLVLLQARHSAG